MAKRIIEIDGMKVEVDLETARRVDTFKVGDNVKVLRKKTNYDSAKVFPGIITSFDNFKDDPCITVAYYEEEGYGTRPTIKFLYYTAEIAESYEIVFASDNEIRLSGDGIIEKFEREIESKMNEAKELQIRLDYFKNYFLPKDKKEEDHDAE